MSKYIGEYERQRFNIIIDSIDFSDAFALALKDLKNPEIAKLIIADQFGIKDVNIDILKCAKGFDTTDIIFFVSSSVILRFWDHPSFALYYPDLANMPKPAHGNAHRFVCNYFRSKLGEISYYFVPFSLKKDKYGAINGLIFGSRHLYGIYKFLRICWRFDEYTGEANFDIDEDKIDVSQPSLFADRDVPKKRIWFEGELIDLIMTEGITNTELCEFALMRGFLPRHVNDIIKPLVRNGTIKSRPIGEGRVLKSGSTYVSWNNYNEPPKLRFIKGDG